MILRNLAEEPKYRFPQDRMLRQHYYWFFPVISLISGSTNTVRDITVMEKRNSAVQDQ